MKKLILVLAIVCTGVMAHFAFSNPMYCMNDADCPEGMRCVNNICVSGEEVTGPLLQGETTGRYCCKNVDGYSCGAIDCKELGM